MDTDPQSVLDTLFNILSPHTALQEVLPAFTAPDWQQLERSAAGQGLTLVLYDRLSGVQDLVPAAVWESLRAKYLQATARNMLMLHHAGVILGALRARGVEVIVLKGLFLQGVGLTVLWPQVLALVLYAVLVLNLARKRFTKRIL